MKYADVILPLPLENSYTYSIPTDLEAAVTPGCRVIVHFGKKRYYTAIVMEVHERRPNTDFETKEIYALLDASPVLRRPQLRFGNGSPLIICVNWEMSIKRLYLPG